MSGDMSDDSKIWQTRETAKNTLITEMRDGGYVPLIDLDPAWSLEYDEVSRKFSFVMTIHGAFVGKKRSWEVYGLSGNREVMME